MNDTATGMLRAEHRLILEVASVLERALDAGGGDFDTLDECVAFFRLFADACHHGKEEDLLFPALQHQGMPGDVGPIAVMLHEHGLGREFVRRMAQALPGAGDGDAVASAEVADAGRGYIDLIRAHIAKEDGILFEMADGMVVGHGCKDLCSAYDEVCARRFEGKTLEDLEGLAESLRGRYPAV
ncbi:MAG: hemerythrin domain-containing protein [Acidimicrobiia bacterium]